jgi:3-oxoacyl-[acyl-carrier protein] reductase
VAYAASKAGLAGVMRSLKNEIVALDSAGRVNLVEPGWTDTPMAAAAMDDAVQVERSLSTTPLRRIGSPEDVAATCIFLASPTMARHLTGQVIGVHGGMEGRRLW